MSEVGPRDIYAPDGTLNISKLAAVYVEKCCRFKDRDDDLHWSYEIASNIVRDDAEMAWRFMLAAIKFLTTSEQACILAAGELENMIFHHGTSLVEQIENEAKRNARFRYVLSGVWPQGKTDDIWQRILAVRAAGPDIDAGDALPSN